MYSLEDLNTFEKDSPTNMPCAWTKKPTTDGRPCDVKDLKIERCELPQKKRKNEHIYCEHIDVDVRHENDQELPSDESIKRFAQSLSDSGTRPTILPLLTKLYNPPQDSEKVSQSPAPLILNNLSMGLWSRS